MSKLSILCNPFEWGPLLAFQKRKHNELYGQCTTNRHFAQQFLAKYIPAAALRRKGKAVDIGCGKGRIAAMLALAGFSVVGIDTQHHDFWRTVEQRTGAHFITGSAEHLPFSDASIDLCTAFLSLEYMKRDAQTIAEAFRVLKPGGILFLQVANKRNLKSLVWGKKLDPLHVQEYDAQDLQALLHRFSIIRIWSEKVYLPVATSLFNYVYELCLGDHAKAMITKLTPERLRGCINVAARVPA